MIEAKLPPIPGAAIPVPKGSIIKATALDIARSLARLALRRRRTAARVAAEYNDGAWTKALNDGVWQDARSLDEFLAGTDLHPMVARLHGTAVRIPRQEYYRWRMDALRVIAQATIPDGPVVELGSGIGINLFTLAADRRLTPLLGLDISPIGANVGRQVAEHFRIRNLSFGEIDLTDMRHPGFKEVVDTTVLTYYCLEQLPNDLERVVRSIAAGAPRRVVHIESAAGLLRPTRLADAATAIYVRSMDYQRSLVATLDRLARQGVVRLIRSERMMWGPTLHNDPALIVWEPR